MSKAYFYNVWNTVHPEEVKAVLDHANQVRYGLKNEGTIGDNCDYRGMAIAARLHAFREQVEGQDE